MSEENPADITSLTVQLLSAFVSNNSVPSESLADLIRTTRAALTDNPSAGSVESPAVTYAPAVSVRKSLSSPEHILSMIDGKPYKTLKRHLATHGLSPDAYRERYNLPKSYPLVAPSYSEARRAVATRLGLGRKPVGSTKAAPAAKSTLTIKAAPEAKAAPADKKAAPAKASAAKPAPEAKAAPAAAISAQAKTATKATKAPAAKSAKPAVAKSAKASKPTPAKAKAEANKGASSKASGKTPAKAAAPAPTSIPADQTR